MAYKCPDCNTYFYGDFCPKCAKSAADCIEMSELEIEEDKKAAKKKEKAGGEGQAVCPKCGRVFEGLFCPFCGYGAEEAGIERLEDEEVAAQEEAFRQEDKRAEEEKKREEQEQTAAAAVAEKAEEGAGASGEKTKSPKCGKGVEGTFCPYCGTQVQQQNKCPHCGTERAKDAKFCPVCGYDYVNNTFAKQYYAFKRERRENAGKIVKQKFSAAVSSAKVHKKRVITAVLAIAVILAIVVPVSVVFTSPVQPANVDRINIGDTQAHVVSVLGDPYNYKKGDTTFNYYSDNYLNIRKQLDEIADMDDIGSFSDLADAIEKEEELNQKLETLEYKRTTVTFDEGGLVTQIVYNASIVDNVSQPKELKSQEVITESVRIYEASDVVYTLKYDDGSIYKSIASVTAEAASAGVKYPFTYKFEIYDPFSESGAKISMECSVVENPDSTILYALTIGGVSYKLTTGGTLTISGEGKVLKNAVSEQGSIKNIIVGDGITAIERGAFSGCGNLESITLPFIGSSLEGTENEHFGYIFGGYNSYYDYDAVPDSLKEVIITGGTSIGSGAFSGCSGLTSITIPDSVTNIGERAFSGCSGLTSITIPDSVTSIGQSAFNGCSGLTSIIIPDSVTNIGDEAFYNCSALTMYCEVGSKPGAWSSSWNGDCPVVWNCNNNEADNDGNIYYIAENGIRYALNNGTAAVIRQSTTLSGEIIIPAEITYKDAVYSVTSVGNGAFSYCYGLTSIIIGGSVTSIGDSAFYNCSGLTSITMSNSITSIGRTAFYYCSGLTSITIPDSVTSIEYEAFNGCDNISEVHITDLAAWCNIEFVNSIANPLYYAHNLYLNGVLISQLEIPHGVTSIGDYAFSYCSGLTSITIPDSVTIIGYEAFWNCSGLTSITIGGSVTSIGNNAFYNCSGLTSITIPDSVTSIGYGAFSDCSGLTSIIIPESVTSIGSNAFRNCGGLTSITVEQGNVVYHSAGNCIIVTASKTLIAGCKNSIIPNDGSVTSIGDYAFYDCGGLTSITIPDSVTSIGISAFEDCSGLTSIDYQGTMAQWKAIRKDRWWADDTGNFTITCTDGTLDKNGNQI